MVMMVFYFTLNRFFLKGLIEFLMDRSSETFKDCKHVKYNIVCNLALSESVFDQNAVKKLKQFINEGPFYVQTVMEVAVE